MSDTNITPIEAVFGRVTYPPGGTLGPRQQMGLQIFAIESGTATITVDGQRLRVDEDQCCLLSPGRIERFRFAKDRPTRHTWVSIDLPPDQRRAFVKTPAPVASHPVSPRLNQLIALGLQTPRTPDGPSHDLALALGLSAYHAFRVIVRGGHAGPKPLAPPLEKACTYLDEHLPEPMSVTDLAEAAGVTPSHLNRLFKQHLGTTPSRHLWNRRTQHGRLLLQQTGLSISEIAYQVGFATPYHFSRSIKNRYGQSPRALRQSP